MHILLISCSSPSGTSLSATHLEINHIVVLLVVTCQYQLWGVRVHFIFMLLIDYQFHFLKVEWCFTFPIVNLHPRLLDVRGPSISAHLRVQLQSISAPLRSKHATPVVAMQLWTPCATLITSKNPPPQHQPRYTHLAYLLYSPFSRLSDIYSCHP